jgi:hypothetical protein
MAYPGGMGQIDAWQWQVAIFTQQSVANERGVCISLSTEAIHLSSAERAWTDLKQDQRFKGIMTDQPALLSLSE